MTSTNYLDKCGSRRMGIPYTLELIPINENEKYMYNPDVLKVMCRIGAELGADAIKTVYAEPPEKFIDIIETSGVPIIIAGGEKMSSTTDFIKTIWKAIKAGASGTAIDKNVWQSSNPRFVTSTIWKIIHNKIDLNNALEILGV